MTFSLKRIRSAAACLLTLWLVSGGAWGQPTTEAQEAAPAVESGDDNQTSADPLEQARTQAASGDVPAAVQTLDGVVAGDGDEAEKVQARYLKGMVLLGAGDRLGARDTFQALIDDYPELPEPYNNLAAIYAAEADLEQARELLLELLRRQPDYAVGYENLGDIYAKMAADAYARANELSADPGRLPEKLELLGRLFGTPD
jgi:Flp pilus assembly protein TadD